VRLVGPTGGLIDIVGIWDGGKSHAQCGVRLTRTLEQGYAEFLEGHTKLAALLRGVFA
jgi:hypothetical protein